MTVFVVFALRLFHVDKAGALAVASIVHMIQQYVPTTFFGILMLFDRRGSLSSLRSDKDNDISETA
jgi:uncharacterized membrane protein YbhN (UPF0104 family)